MNEQQRQGVIGYRIFVCCRATLCAARHFLVTAITEYVLVGTYRTLLEILTIGFSCSATNIHLPLTLTDAWQDSRIFAQVSIKCICSLKMNIFLMRTDGSHNSWLYLCEENPNKVFGCLYEITVTLKVVPKQPVTV